MLGWTGPLRTRSLARRQVRHAAEVASARDALGVGLTRALGLGCYIQGGLVFLNDLNTKIKRVLYCSSRAFYSRSPLVFSILALGAHELERAPGARLEAQLQRVAPVAARLSNNMW